MPDDGFEFDAQIIRAAYAEKVSEAFKVFAENIGMGQSEQTAKERFLRSLELVKKARDAAIDTLRAGPAARRDAAAAAASATPTADGEALSPEDQAAIDAALAGTTGHRSPLRR